MKPVSPPVSAPHPTSSTPSTASTRRARPAPSELRSSLTACWPDLYRRALRLGRNQDLVGEIVTRRLSSFLTTDFLF